MNVARFVLPKSPAGLPYVCEDGLLPNPACATLCAVSVQAANPEKLAAGTGKDEILLAATDGFQVEWRSFESYLRWVIYQEAADVKADCRVRVHLCDSVLNLLSMAQESGSIKNAQEAYIASMHGQVGHKRVRDLGHVLHNVEPAALSTIATWTVMTIS